MVFGYPREILDSSAPRAVTSTTPIPTLSRATSQRNLARNARTAGLGNGHFSTEPPSEMNRAAYSSHLATSRGGVATNTQIVTTEEAEYKMYRTNTARGLGPHDPRLSISHGSRPATYIQAYTAADIAAGLCPNPPPRSGTPGGPRRDYTRQPSNGSSAASTARGDTSAERRERTSRWLNYGPSQSSSTQEAPSLGHRQSISTLRRIEYPSQDTGALHTTSQRYGASGLHGLTPPQARVYGGEGEPTVRKRSPLMQRPASGPRSQAPPAIGHGRAGEPVVRTKSPSLRRPWMENEPVVRTKSPPLRRPWMENEPVVRTKSPSLRRPWMENEPSKALKSAMKNTGSEETGSGRAGSRRTGSGRAGSGKTGRSVKFAREKSVNYYNGAGN